MNFVPHHDLIATDLIGDDKLDTACTAARDHWFSTFGADHNAARDQAKADELLGPQLMPASTNRHANASSEAAAITDATNAPRRGHRERMSPWGV